MTEEWNQILKEALERDRVRFNKWSWVIINSTFCGVGLGIAAFLKQSGGNLTIVAYVFFVMTIVLFCYHMWIWQSRAKVVFGIFIMSIVSHIIYYGVLNFLSTNYPFLF